MCLFQAKGSHTPSFVSSYLEASDDHLRGLDEASTDSLNDNDLQEAISDREEFIKAAAASLYSGLCCLSVHAPIPLISDCI